MVLPSTKEVNRVTFAALRRPAGKAKPILSNLSLRYLPPFLDLALKRDEFPQLDQGPTMSKTCDTAARCCRMSSRKKF